MSETELFKEFSEQKRKRWFLFNSQTKSPFHPGRVYLTVSYENIAFCGIVAVMVLVVVFALGVEKGKNAMSRKLQVVSHQLPATPVKIATIQPAAPVVVPKPTEAPKVGDYTVQVAAYVSNQLAQKACREIERRDYSPFIIISGNRYQVCIGRYSSRKDAEKALQNIKKIFKGAFVRYIRDRR